MILSSYRDFDVFHAQTLAPTLTLPFARICGFLPTQVQIVKQLDEFRGKLAGFASRWAELKPKGGPSGNPALVLQKIEEYSAAIQVGRSPFLKRYTCHKSFSELRCCRWHSFTTLIVPDHKWASKSYRGTTH